MAKGQKRGVVSGVTVYPRGKTFAYNVDLGPDPLTNERRRAYKGGFATDDDAWAEAIAVKSALESGTYVAPAKRTVREFLTEWLTSIEHSVKVSTYTNYVDYTDAYVVPAIGKRRLQDVDVQVLNLLYRHLLEKGRRKVDTNSVMFEFWRSERDAGRDPKPAAIAEACGTSIYAARHAVLRYRAGRFPAPTTTGLAPKTVKNVHRLLHRALSDAVAWRYVGFNPAVHASLPRTRRATRNRPKPWTIEELSAWLGVALKDRDAGLWALVATTGMRRSELAGVTRAGLDLGAGLIAVEDTRVVVGGQVVDEDGKTDSSVRTLSLDPFTVAALRRHLAMLDGERDAFGSEYPDHGRLFCHPDGSSLHPDTITRRFHRLVDRAGVRRIRLHDVRHTYATTALDSGIKLKEVSDRLGHAHIGVTSQIYSHRSTGQDRAAADAFGALLFGVPEAE